MHVRHRENLLGLIADAEKALGDGDPARLRRTFDYMRKYVMKEPKTRFNPDAPSAQQVLKSHREASERGRTTDEVEIDTKQPHQAASPNVIGLRRYGLLRYIGIKRRTRYGGMADVHVCTERGKTYTPQTLFGT